MGIVYLNTQRGFISREEAELFLPDALEHEYKISRQLIEQMFALLPS